MTTEQRNKMALEVAKKEGVIFDSCGNPDSDAWYEYEVISDYISFNYLMPIVERVNKENKYNITMSGRTIYIHKQNVLTQSKNIDYSEDNTLLDALLQAVHYVICGEREK